MATRRHVAFMVLAALAVTGLARAQSPGPDIIVGDLPDATSYGKVGSTFAYDLGTTSCNVGNVNVRWQAGTPDHPVIAQNVFRYSAGRFEQIGMSWVKHGFLALNQNLCGTCNGQGGSVLGVGCSDPYEFGINGEQTGLGPRSQINPVSGAFVYDPFSWPAITSDLSRRIQIAESDIDPALNPGALFFGEGLYISPDESATRNGWNNASYTRVQFANNLSRSISIFPGFLTRRTQPAIFAWKAQQPSVAVVGYDVPSDGRFWIAADATSNGDGTWRYEYAVYNLNSARAGGSFIVPLPAGATVTNAAARIIPHHSGEPYTNAPWTVTTTASGVGFSTPQAFAENPDSSALRWGTLYNFRFDASVAPADGCASVGLFAPGQGPAAAMNEFTVAIPTPGGAQAVAHAPSNDECAGAAPLHFGENRFSTLGATSSAQVTPSCPAISADAWFSYTYIPYAPTCPGQIVFDTCGSAIDTAIAVYSTCPATGDAALACDDNGAACSSSPGASRVSVPAVAGQTYLLRVGSPSGQSGTLVVNVAAPFCIAPNGACCTPLGACSIVQGAASCFDGNTFLGSGTTCSPNPCPQPPPPPNDACANAISIGDNQSGAPALVGTNVSADNSVIDTCPASTFGQRDVWYVYVPANNDLVTVDTCLVPPGGSDMDTVISIRDGSCTGAQIACNDDASISFCGPLSALEFNAVAGRPYFIRVAGYLGGTGRFTLRVRGGQGTGTGACCQGAICTLTTDAACVGSFTSFRGFNTVCNPASDVLPCCRADFNRSGGLSALDIFEYLNAWFQSDPIAAFANDSTPPAPRPPVVADLFNFLNAWFIGC
ncbi:MAG: hypothetical protein K2W85_14400 [Phycisphaerales bacterium]|nr:hypothetical protein [Phycisphaerales bacterium]